jgi:hypothetical protein
MPVPCLRAGLFIYLLIYLYLSCYGNVLLRDIVVLVLLFSHLSSCGSCGLCGSCRFGSCLRAGRGIVIRLIISIVGSSHRDRDAERNSFPVFS